MDSLLTDIGQRILQLRKSKHLTQKALRPENIVQISQALKVLTDYLLTGPRNLIDYAMLNQKLSYIEPPKYDPCVSLKLCLRSETA